MSMKNDCWRRNTYSVICRICARGAKTFEKEPDKRWSEVNIFVEVQLAPLPTQQFMASATSRV